MAAKTTKIEGVTLTMDGQELTVPRGTTLLQAAQGIGTEVPHYCYHPGLSSPAQCRLCLVEVEGAPKLLPSCTTTVADGQVVHTQSDNATQMRRGVLEFYLLNHPLVQIFLQGVGRRGLPVAEAAIERLGIATPDLR